MIPVNEPLLSGNEQKYVQECLSTGWISSEGPYVSKFEKLWADYCNMPYGVAVSSGTAALKLAVEALGLCAGREIIVPSFTIIACVQAILDVGCRPVLVDCDPDTWCMDLTETAAKITDRTSAIMPVHIYGHPVDMDAVQHLAQQHSLLVIEDAAEAHGATCRGRRVGGLSDISCFSFYANKILSTGEGGMVLTKSPVHAERVRSLRNLAFRTDRRFYHTERGYNFRLTNVQAAIGVAQVENISRHLQKKREIARQYREQLQGLPLQLPVEKAWAENVYWMYGVVLNDDVPIDATLFALRLAEAGVATRPFFLGMHEQPVFRDMGLFSTGHYPVTERISRRGLYLPTGLTLAPGDIRQVVEAVRKVLRP